MTHFRYWTPTQQGWECPKCGTVYAPWCFKCDCASKQGTVTTGGTTCSCPEDTGGHKQHLPACPFGVWQP